MQHREEAMLLADQMRTQCLGVRVGRMHRLVSRTFEQCLRPLGLSLPQLELLSTLTMVDRAVRPGELAEILAVERSTMSRNLSLMQQRGWVETIETSPTGRSMSVRISAAGSAHLADARVAWESAQQDLVTRLGHDAPAALDTWIGKLLA